MDNSQLLQMLAAANGAGGNKDMTNLLSAMSSGGDMSSILPVLMNMQQKNGASGTVSDSRPVSTQYTPPSDDEINFSLKKLNGKD